MSSITAERGDLAMGFDFAAVYEGLNPDDDDYRFYAALAEERAATLILDLGCGTGRLARLLAAAGRSVVGIDPDPEMIRVARAAATAAKITWRLGTSDSADPSSADLAVMTGHVAQVFLDDDEWARTLADLYQALVPGGVLAFESRNPGARGWKKWTRAQTLRTVETPEGPVEFWHETASVDLPLVAYDTFDRNLRTGAETVTRDVLAFRDPGALNTSLLDAGFSITAEYGDWARARVSTDSPEIIIVAEK
jgi:SAM-dependent methyltransferase